MRLRGFTLKDRACKERVLMMGGIVYVVALVITSWLIVCGAFELTIVHNNDIHTHFVPAARRGSRCREGEVCYGGYARIKAFVDSVKSKKDHVLHLNAGDNFQGTTWYVLFKGGLVSAFMNKVSYDAVCLGNHEFDDGILGILPFLQNATFPILSANLNSSKIPGVSSVVVPNVVLDLNGTNVGIVGYLTAETAQLSRPGPDVTFEDEIAAISDSVSALKADGVQIILALGHSGIEKDKEIAAQVAGVDLIIGGHSHTLLYTGEPPDSSDTEAVYGPYPMLIKNMATGVDVPIVHCYQYGKYICQLDLEFDEDGSLVKWNGKPHLLDPDVPSDDALMAELAVWEKQLGVEINSVVGFTVTELESEKCRQKECTAGNMMADAMRSVEVIEARGGKTFGYIDASLVNGGAIRAPIEAGEIVLDDVLTMSPFGNPVWILNFTGETLRKIFEESANRIGRGGFLQVSGFRVTLDTSQDLGSAVKELKVLCRSCQREEYVPVEDGMIYRVAMPRFLAEGGDGYVIFEEHVGDIAKTGVRDYEIVEHFINTTSPLSYEIEARISFEDDSTGSQANRNTNHILQMFSIGIIIFVMIRF